MDNFVKFSFLDDEAPKEYRVVSMLRLMTQGYSKNVVTDEKNACKNVQEQSCSAVILQNLDNFVKFAIFDDGALNGYRMV